MARHLVVRCVAVAALALLFLSSPLCVDAGPLIGIIPMDSGPTSGPSSLPSGPFIGDSGKGSQPPNDITIEGEGMLTPDPTDVWNKDIVWDFAGEGLIPNQSRLCVMESITLWNLPGSTDLLQVADWHETLAGGSLPLAWDLDSAALSARVGATPIPLDVEIGVSDDGREIWFKFDPLRPGPFGAPIPVPVTLEITKYIKYVGDIPITGSSPDSTTEVRIMQQPSTTPEPSGLALLGVAVFAATRRRR